jgi:HlyD family secretion protein
VDRDISPQDRRRTLVRRWIVGLSVAAAVWLASSWGFGLLRASVKRSQLRTAIVDMGPVDASISATGNVVPEVEQVISSPVDARVVKILKRAGAEVREGDPLLQLDVSQSVLALGKLDQDLAIKSNQQARAKLQLENTLSEIQSQVEVKKLQLESSSPASKSPAATPRPRTQRNSRAWPSSRRSWQKTAARPDGCSTWRPRARIAAAY